VSKSWLLLALLFAACASSDPPAERQRARDWRTLTSTRQFAGEKSLAADVEYGAGTLTIAPAAPGTLYRSDLRYDGSQVQPDVGYTDGRFHFGMDGKHISGNRHYGERNRLDLQFGPDTPLSLDLKFGAGKATIDLGGLDVTSLSIATGASESLVSFSTPTKGACQDVDLQAGAAQMTVTGLGNLSPRSLTVQGGVGDVTLDFSGAWRNDLSGKISMGIGSLHLNMPRGIGLKVNKTSMLASFDAPGMVKQGSVYVSQGYQSAQRHIEIDIDAAFGSINVKWIGDAASGGSF
jgi:hypothetical protein